LIDPRAPVGVAAPTTASGAPDPPILAAGLDAAVPGPPAPAPQPASSAAIAGRQANTLASFALESIRQG
jgi:hypothetical protein